MIRTLASALVLAAAVLSTDVAAAQNFDPRSRYSADEARDARDEGRVLPARQVIDSVRRRYPGAQVLDAELVGSRNPFYIIKILTSDGRRRDVRVDARTGRILS
ncbi:hypothetical protein DDZ18_09995 [Marinicauda salina]|uniref:PepSY domain-containing protein n=1 Tax=Marinicauda salina TaxID=2135793 RepID=A0A2U2BSR1_9PROT|nr:PepSY domain-containing protein [Marinicauda salina]PWE17027.1 hypothetical protein DDZ18_09995 [Marinicauda salina]